MKPVLSLIVPVYNVEPYIRQCLDSLVNQTYQDMEIIVVDDGSPDNCGAICDEYAAKYPQLRVIHQRNGGLSAARNRGMSEAKGKWLAFADSDDWCDHDYYEKLFQRLGNREVDIFCANGHIEEYPGKSEAVYNFFGEFDYQERVELDTLMERTIAINAGLVWNLPLRTFATPWDKLYRAEFVCANHLSYDMEIKAREDALFNYQAFYKASRVAGGEIVGYHMRFVSNSITHKYNPERLKIDYGYLERIHDTAPEKFGQESMKQAFYISSMSKMSDILRLSYLNPENHASNAEIRREIQYMKSLPYFKEALLNSPNHIFSIRLLILKYLLRQPFLWPLKLAVKANEWRKRR